LYFCSYNTFIGKCTKFIIVISKIEIGYVQLIKDTGLQISLSVIHNRKPYDQYNNISCISNYNVKNADGLLQTVQNRSEYNFLGQQTKKYDSEYYSDTQVPGYVATYTQYSYTPSGELTQTTYQNNRVGSVTTSEFCGFGNFGTVIDSSMEASKYFVYDN
jgi:hypothetical protein